MHHIRSMFALLALAVLGLSACTDDALTRSPLANAQYWERSNATGSIYLEGPKAQQMLQRDIAHCVTDIRELERLGAIRHAVPAETHLDGQVPDTTLPEGALELYQSPRRDHFLYAEYYNYHDFETCMQAKGWERVQYLPYDRAMQSRQDYINAIAGQRYQTRNSNQPVTKVTTPSPDDNGTKPAGNDFKNLNH